MSSVSHSAAVVASLLLFLWGSGRAMKHGPDAASLVAIVVAVVGSGLAFTIQRQASALHVAVTALGVAVSSALYADTLRKVPTSDEKETRWERARETVLAAAVVVGVIVAVGAISRLLV